MKTTEVALPPCRGTTAAGKPRRHHRWTDAKDRQRPDELAQRCRHCEMVQIFETKHYKRIRIEE